MSAACPILSFVVRVNPREAGAKVSSDAFADSLIEMLDSNGLTSRRRGDGFVISRDGSQATQTDRELFLRWAEGWKSVARIEVSDLVDLREE